LQVAPEQQPLGQLVALQPLHTPPTQLCPPGQASQAPPPLPQEAALLPGRQAPPEQQPVAHDVPSHTQVLATHRCPGVQASTPPQRQVPPEEQLSERSSQTAQVEPAAPQVASERVSHRLPRQQPLGQDVASQVHRPPLQRCPPLHAEPDPHAQVPSAPQ
jgi:hypothetical protein